MLNKKGFTLIELLVVIAIITILASIVAPRVMKYIARGKMAKAVSEIRNVDLALAKLSTDVEWPFRKVFLWNPPFPNSLDNIQKVIEVYTQVFYEVLRRGKDANLDSLGVTINARAKEKMATSYMDIGLDPWGERYRFFLGSLSRIEAIYHIYPFRSYRGPWHDANGDGVTNSEDYYIYDAAAKGYEDGYNLGNPGPDDLPGYPCPADLDWYIYSLGGEGLSNQMPANLGDIEHNGGDDINNWDNASGWYGFYAQ